MGIGVILRDSHGVAQVRFVTGNKILRILKRKGLAPDLPEDIYFLIKKAVSIRKHLERNRKARTPSSGSFSSNPGSTGSPDTTRPRVSFPQPGSTSRLLPPPWSLKKPDLVLPREPMRKYTAEMKPEV